MAKEKRLYERKLKDSDIDEYCSSVEKTLTQIKERKHPEENRKKTRKEIVYCLEDVLYY